MPPGASNKGSLRRLDLKGAVTTYNQRDRTRRGEGQPGRMGLQEGSRASTHLRPWQGGSWGTDAPVSNSGLPPIPCSCPLWSGLICKSRGREALCCSPKTVSLLEHTAGWRQAAGRSEVTNGKYPAHPLCFSSTLQLKHLSYSTNLITPSLHLKVFNGSLLPQMVLEPLNTIPALFLPKSLGGHPSTLPLPMAPLT